jgi:hypothetical protein
MSLTAARRLLAGQLVAVGRSVRAVVGGRIMDYV